MPILYLTPQRRFFHLRYILECYPIFIPYLWYIYGIHEWDKYTIYIL